MSKICYLHVGMGKTGSTAIQAGLATFHDALRKQGFLYPDLSANFVQVRERKPTTGNGALIIETLKRNSTAAALDLVKPLAAIPMHLVLSCEGFGGYHLTPKVKEFAAGLRSLGYDTKCLVIFRPQAEALVSSFLQGVKTNKLRDGVTLDTYVSEEMIRKVSRSWSWEERSKSFEEAFGDVTVKWHPALRRLGPGGVLQSVFDWLELPALSKTIDLSSGAFIMNPTPGREAVIVLQAIKKKWSFSGKFAYVFLSRAEQAGLLGTKVTLERPVLERVWLATQQSNARLLRQYCPDLSPEIELSLPAAAEPDQPLNKEVLQGLAEIAARMLSHCRKSRVRERRYKEVRNDLLQLLFPDEKPDHVSAADMPGQLATNGISGLAS